MPIVASTESAPPLLRVRGLTVAYRQRRGPVSAPSTAPGEPQSESLEEHPDQHTVVVRDLSFDVARGETVALVGESGCGKTTAALSLLGLLPTAARRLGGRITLSDSGKRGGTTTDAGSARDGIELTTLDEAGWRGVRGRRIGMIFQDPAAALNPLLTIGRQLGEAVRQHRRITRRNARRRALELLEQVAMPDPERRLRAYPHQLSGGQRQRAMIALALASEPELLVADEPTTALDVTLQAQILSLLARLQKTMSLSVILVTHNLVTVAAVSDRILVMVAGELVEQGPTSEVYATPGHPYTQALVAARPRLGVRRPRGETGAVEASELVATTRGCTFAPRCQSVMDRCRDQPPALVQLSSNRFSRCHLASRPPEPGAPAQ